MDHRDLAAMLPQRLKPSRDGQTVTVELYDDEQGDYTATLPAKFDVCPTCEGRGSHVNPSIDAHGISADELYDDPDFAESYFRGDYDQPCNECGGQRVVPTIDRDRLSGDDKRIVALVDRQAEDDYAYARGVEAERRFGY